MLNIAGIFKNRTPDTSRLLEFGFSKLGEEYSTTYSILAGKFQMNVIISQSGEMSVKVLDTDNQEEYVLVHTPDASGAFVGSVIQECEDRLKSISANCFNFDVFKSEQAKQIIAYVNETYQNQLEFLWEKFPNNAVFRCKDGGKWYAAILTVSTEKLGLEKSGMVEIIVLRALPNEITELVDGKKYFPGYHMNKKHWYAICLDSSVSTQEICSRIETSYSLTKK